MEVSGGLGFAVGPPIGGLLYAVSQNHLQKTPKSLYRTLLSFHDHMQVGGFRLPFLVVGVTCLAFLPLIFLLVPNSSKRA